MGGYTTSVCNKPTRSTQPCIPLGSLNRVPALTGWGKGGNVTSAGWQVILCDPIWHVSSRSSEACCELLYAFTYFTLLTPALYTLATVLVSHFPHPHAQSACLIIDQQVRLHLAIVSSWYIDSASRNDAGNFRSRETKPPPDQHGGVVV